MLLRSLLLLLLCVSTATSATLGHYQAQAEEEEETPAVTDFATPDIAPLDVQADDPTADNSLFGDDLSAKTQADQDADKPEVEVPEGEREAAAAEETEAKSDGPVEDTDAHAAEAVTQEQAASEAEQPSSEEAVNQEKPAEEAVIQEEPAEEAVIQEKPAEEEKEDNEIKPVLTNPSESKEPAEEESSWSFNSIRNSFQSMHGYFDSLVELVGGRDGVCQYRCRYGETPQPRPGYQLPEPNGCSSSLVGFQLDLGIPAMTKCCNELDLCYDTCGTSKYDCDSRFRSCLHSLCSDLNRSLGFVSKVQTCESMADTVFNTVWTLGCRPYMNSQRAACFCEGEERDEL
ncbi:hypothetical protein L3Q82_011752 [Xyrichtys novacula]|uniref:Group XIIB secretory phospholipase A2-like protein n=1 Tax=Xyrichtys novacula TaxID=13765 RepID=A0AAV1G463_XYRNO|nr:hypothetical protein L3Q82_011752 [Xyrichtys novacula]